MTDATASRRELMIDRMLENKKLAIGDRQSRKDRDIQGKSGRTRDQD
jgi:hypothetical protein